MWRKKYGVMLLLLLLAAFSAVSQSVSLDRDYIIKKLTDYQLSLIQAEKDLNQYKGNVATCLQTIADLEKQLADTKGKSESFIADLRKQLDEQKKKLERLEMDLKKQEETYDQLSKELESLKITLAVLSRTKKIVIGIAIGEFVVIGVLSGILIVKSKQKQE